MYTNQIIYIPYCNDVTTAYSNTKNVKIQHKGYVRVAVNWTYFTNYWLLMLW